MEECLLYREPELYDLLFPSGHAVAALTDDIRGQRILASERFYLDEASHGGRALELACGSGRLTVPIAQKGIEIVGLDSSASMLDAARSRAAAAGVQVELVRGDMRSFDFPNQFLTILIAGNSLLHLLTAEDLKKCLSCVRRHLAPGGRFLFDVFNPDMRLLARDPGRRYGVFSVKDLKRGEISIEETATYDAATQVRHIRWYLSSPNAPDFRIIDYELGVIYPEELLLLLETTGLQLEARYGEFTREPFESSSPRQVCVCCLRN